MLIVVEIFQRLIVRGHWQHPEVVVNQGLLPCGHRRLRYCWRELPRNFRDSERDAVAQLLDITALEGRLCLEVGGTVLGFGELGSRVRQVLLCDCSREVHVLDLLPCRLVVVVIFSLKGALD